MAAHDSVVATAVSALSMGELCAIPGASCLSLKGWFGEDVSCDAIRDAARARLEATPGVATYATLRAMRREAGWP